MRSNDLIVSKKSSLLLLLTLYSLNIFQNVHASPHRDLSQQLDHLEDEPASDEVQAQEAAAAQQPQAMDVDPNSDLAGNAEEGGLDPLAVLPFFAKPVSRDFDEDLLNEPTPKIRLHAIEPAQGPVTGETRVLVRGGPFTRWEREYPNPKCKFGADAYIVPATYVSCAQNITSVFTREARSKDREFKCLQCDNNQPVQFEQTISFTVSLTGDFSDCLNSVPFSYYPQTHIHAIYPRYGPKDGDTPVKVWGENFRSFGDNSRCAFGTRTTQADIKNEGYLECHSPPSDVVQKPIPFSISLNNQQNSRDTKFFWYYNWPSIQEISPSRGPEAGGTVLEIKGRNFFPFREELDSIDNANDTFCGFLELKVRVPATVHSSTRATCVAPPSYYWRQTRVEFTLNGLEYSEDENVFNYYKPPFLFDIEPTEGPLAGGTQVIVVGSGFENTGEIKCQFNDLEVEGQFLSPSQIKCASPRYHTPGFVDLKIALKEHLWSSAIPYLYYETPVINSISPVCGPDSGFTQIEVRGSNFVDLGHDKAMCVFNETIFTNATIMDDTWIMCDSPAFENSQGYSLIGTLANNFYSLKITIDGGKEVAGVGQQFTYYKQASVNKVSPFGGPLSGNSKVSLKVDGLHQPGLCDVRVRFSTFELRPTILNDTLEVTAPAVNLPGSVVVQVTYNGQQYQTERIAHVQDPKASYHYYDQPFVTFHQPFTGPSIGGTRIRIQGHGLAPLLPQDPTKTGKHNKLWARFVNPSTGVELQAPTQINQEELSNDEALWYTPGLPAGTKVLLQISPNKSDWVSVKAPNSDYSFTYYEAPHITGISPTFGPVKDENIEMTIDGKDFICPDPACKHLRVRFGEHPHAIYMPATLESATRIKVRVPKYTKPDVLRVELTLNGADYTHDNKNYGFYDPYVIDVQPRLISVDGSTQVTIRGIGFVDSGETKGKFTNSTNPIKCDNNGSPCMHQAVFVDKNHIRMSTWPQTQVQYAASGANVMWDPIEVEASVNADQFTTNGITLQYYNEPTYADSGFDKEAPANIQNTLLIGADIHPRDVEAVSKHANPACRFKHSDGREEQTHGILLHAPIDIAQTRHSAQAPNSVKCKTPVWNMNGQMKETVTLDISMNGQNFKGGFQFTFTESLMLHRTVPMAGPLTGNTKTRLIGTGFKLGNNKMAVGAKWGAISDAVVQKSEVLDYVYQKTAFENIIQGSEELRAYAQEASNFERVDAEMTEDFTYSSVYSYSSRIQGGSSNRRSLSEQPLHAAYAGQWYVEVGTNTPIPYGAAAVGNSTAVQTNSWTYYDYEPSSVEFYQYTQPQMLSMHPHSGLIRGGTEIEVIGSDFRYIPEYGVVPHCKFGNKIVRAVFESTVRIVCPSPVSEGAQTDISFEVSLNGVDWTSTGFTFSYYEEPIMQSSFPESGSVKGGTEIYFHGMHFPELRNNSREFNCRFTPTSQNMQPRFMPATWVNSTAIMCATPGGWSRGDKMKLQVTFNGGDYDNNGFEFTVYNVAKATPRSGPSNGLGGDIVISGQGFVQTQNNTVSDSQDLSKVMCRLNQTIYEPISVTWKEIRCPMPAAQAGDAYFGNVDFAVTPNGKEWHEFEGGFQYYQQPTVADIYPKTGPAKGVGIINFYGDGFRADYALAELGCKVGNSIGQAVYVNRNQIRCVIEDMETVPEGEYLTAHAALNSYSWTLLDEDQDPATIQYVPYSVSQIIPTSGPIHGGTDVIIQGRGFINGNEPNDQPRCRFGSPSNYAIVEAEVLSYQRMVCKSPAGLVQSYPSVWPVDMPFGIALTQDNFDPWTETSHKFRFYKQPEIARIEPSETNVGSMTEVYVIIDNEELDPQQSHNDNVFFEPLPNSMAGISTDTDFEEDYAPLLASMGAIKCKFGHYGESIAAYVNQTHVKCVTPAVSDDPEDIYRDTVIFSLAMNGYDFDSEESELEFTFVGTGSYFGMGGIVLLIILCGPLIAAAVVFINRYSNQQQILNAGYVHGQQNQQVPNGVIHPQN